MYSDFMSDMVPFTCSFIVVKYDVGVLTSTGYSMIFPTEVSLVLRVYVL